MPPFHPLSGVKAKIRSGEVFLRGNAIIAAKKDFNWGARDIERCLLKLNDRSHLADPDRNHFYKTEEHSRFPHTNMDYYKARRVMEGESVYTHFYVKYDHSQVVVSSFHQLEF
jgi:hypothetical protein